MFHERTPPVKENPIEMAPVAPPWSRGLDAGGSDTDTNWSLKKSRPWMIRNWPPCSQNGLTEDASSR